MSENETKSSAYEKFTPQRKQLVDQVLANLEKGNLFWTQGWVAAGAPESAVTGKKYRGINNLYLSLVAMAENYGDNRWATFRQMEEKGWTFKKDEEGHTLGKGKSVSVEYYEMRDKETKRRFDRSVLDGMTFDEQREYMDKNVYWLRKFYRVFNGRRTCKGNADDRRQRPYRKSGSDPRLLERERIENRVRRQSGVLPSEYGRSAFART